MAFPTLFGVAVPWLEVSRVADCRDCPACTSAAGRRAFEERWGAIARAAGWPLLQLYGLDPIAPRARIGRMGAAFLASLRAHRVIAVDDKAITMVTRTSARLRIFRGDGDQGTVPAWELAGVRAR